LIGGPFRYGLHVTQIRHAAKLSWLLAFAASCGSQSPAGPAEGDDSGTSLPPPDAGNPADDASAGNPADASRADDATVGPAPVADAGPIDAARDASSPSPRDSGTTDASLARDGADAGSGTAGGQEGGAAGDAGATTSYIQNDVFWRDTSGTPIYSQGGGVILVGGVFYWYGVKYEGAVTYAAAPTRLNSNTAFDAVTCYSSTDLVHWKFENDVLPPGNLAPTWLGRMGVAYNAATKKYVLVSQYTGAQGSGELFATSTTPNGVFTVDHVQPTLANVVNSESGDQTLFVDDDGQAYLVFSSADGRAHLYVAPLEPSDFLAVQPATEIFSAPGREGNCMFKYNGRYYFNSSDLHGWNASHTYTISATSILGPYSAETVMANTDADFSHVSQTGFFITVHGTAGSTVVFAGDRWSDFAGNGLGYNQWNPLSFSGTAPQFQSVTQWSIDVAAGTWAVGPQNNYALNPSFEADRVTMTQPAGWVTSTTTAGATPFTNLAGGHTGNWKWRLTSTAAYQAGIAQTVTGLPSGTYTLTAWIQSSGGQSVARMFARDFGGVEKDASVNTAIGTWTQVSIPGIAVTAGTASIGVETTASANQWVDMDDFTLVKN
jgi:hypothetical protein